MPGEASIPVAMRSEAGSAEDPGPPDNLWLPKGVPVDSDADHTARAVPEVAQTSVWVFLQRSWLD